MNILKLNIPTRSCSRAVQANSHVSTHSPTHMTEAQILKLNGICIIIMRLVRNLAIALVDEDRGVVANNSCRLYGLVTLGL
jgi:hypothetical protein